MAYIPAEIFFSVQVLQLFYFVDGLGGSGGRLALIKIYKICVMGYLILLKPGNYHT